MGGSLWGVHMGGPQRVGFPMGGSMWEGSIGGVRIEGVHMGGGGPFGGAIWGDLRAWGSV